MKMCAFFMSIFFNLSIVNAQIEDAFFLENKRPDEEYKIILRKQVDRMNAEWMLSQIVKSKEESDGVIFKKENMQQMLHDLERGHIQIDDVGQKYLEVTFQRLDNLKKEHEERGKEIEEMINKVEESKYPLGWLKQQSTFTKTIVIGGTGVVVSSVGYGIYKIFIEKK